MKRACWSITAIPTRSPPRPATRSSATSTSISRTPRTRRHSSTSYRRGSKLPEHFGNNFDALADSLEDRDWLGKKGCAIRLGHATHYRKTHPNDWGTLEEILSEACTFWRERNLAFWVLVN